MIKKLYLPLDLYLDDIDDLHLLEHHVVDSLTHSPVSLLPSLSECPPLLLLFGIDGLFVVNFFFEFLQIALGIFGYFTEAHQLLLDLLILIVHLLHLDPDLVHEGLLPESTAGVPGLYGWPEGGPKRLPRVHRLPV